MQGVAPRDPIISFLHTRSVYRENERSRINAVFHVGGELTLVRDGIGELFARRGIVLSFN